jgi:hypothetical protein
MDSPSNQIYATIVGTRLSVVFGKDMVLSVSRRLSKSRRELGYNDSRRSTSPFRCCTNIDFADPRTKDELMDCWYVTFSLGT